MPGPGYRQTYAAAQAFKFTCEAYKKYLAAVVPPTASALGPGPPPPEPLPGPRPQSCNKKLSPNEEMSDA